MGEPASKRLVSRDQLRLSSLSRCNVDHVANRVAIVSASQLPCAIQITLILNDANWEAQEQTVGAVCSRTAPTPPANAGDESVRTSSNSKRGPTISADLRAKPSRSLTAGAVVQLQALSNRSRHSHQRPALLSRERSFLSSSTRSLADRPTVGRLSALFAMACHSRSERIFRSLPAKASKSPRRTRSRFPLFRARSFPAQTQRRTVSVDRPVSRGSISDTNSSRAISATRMLYYIYHAVVEVCQ